MQQTTIARFEIGNDKVEVEVQYDRKEPETYEIKHAYHNGNDVTEFYAFADANGEGLFYPQIVEAIAHDMCTERLEKYLDAGGSYGVSSLTQPVASFSGIVKKQVKPAA